MGFQLRKHHEERLLVRFTKIIYRKLSEVVDSMYALVMHRLARFIPDGSFVRMRSYLDGIRSLPSIQKAAPVLRWDIPHASIPILSDSLIVAAVIVPWRQVPLADVMRGITVAAQCCCKCIVPWSQPQAQSPDAILVGILPREQARACGRTPRLICDRILKSDSTLGKRIYIRGNSHWI